MHEKSLLPGLIIFCMILMLFVLVRIGKGAKDHSQRNWALGTGILFMLTDVSSLIFYLRLYGLISIDFSIFYYYNVFHNLLIALSVLSVLKLSKTMLFTVSKFGTYMTYVGMIFSVVMVKAELSLKNSEMFLLEENGNVVWNRLDSLWTYVMIFELGIVLVEAVNNYFQKSNFAYKDRIVPMITFPLILIISLVLQRWFLDIPVWAMGGTLAMFFVYSNRVSELISEDEMTGLGNKRQLYYDMDERINDEKEWCLIIFDANKFKAINDSFGHVEGDSALKEIADCLKKEVIKRHLKAYRFGGDEFMIIADTDNNNDILQLLAGVEKRLTKKNEILQKQYKLSVSYGYAFYNGDECGSIPEIIEKADTAMYAMKKSLKEER